MTGTPEWDVVVVGSVNSDFMVRGGEAAGAGRDDAGARVLRGTGGKGANQAVAAARLGAALVWVAYGGEKQIVSVAGVNGRLTP